MAVDVRELDSEVDLDRVADFFNRNGYGPAGMPLTGRVVGRVFAERGVKLFLIAEERGRIVGTVGYAQTSGRRVAPEGQLFAGMFVIAPSHRSGLLAGRLFADSFERLLRTGVRGLRVEVNPANSRAFPLYVRVGFRALDGLTPDEEGYIELVSVLPGVTTDLLANALEWTGLSVSNQRRNWRTLEGGRRQTVESGVSQLPDGTPTIQYDFELPEGRISTVARADDASIVALAVNGAPARGFEPRSTAGASRRETPASAQVGEFDLSLDTHGTLTVRHAGHLGTVVSDPHPIVKGTAGGSRRPRARRVDISTEQGGWTVTDGDVTRVIRFGASTIEIEARSDRAAPVVGMPWSGMRTAELSLTLPGGEKWSAHAVRGVWPPDLIDFEAAADDGSSWPAAGSRVEWKDHGTGLAAAISIIDAGTVRLEGWHLAHLTGDSSLRYVLNFAAPDDQEETPADLLGTDVVDTWHRARRGLAEVLETTTESDVITVAADSGLIEWTVDRRRAISSTFPSRRTIGPLSGISAALWVCAQSDRGSTDAGAEWPIPSTTLTFDLSGTGDGWRIARSNQRDELVIQASGGQAHTQSGELVMYLTAPLGTPIVRIADSSGAAMDVAVGQNPWRTWTRKAAFPGDGGWLTLAARAGTNDEILVRSTRDGVIAAAFAHTLPASPPTAEWRLRWDRS